MKTETLAEVRKKLEWMTRSPDRTHIGAVFAMLHSLLACIERLDDRITKLEEGVEE